MVMKSDEAKTKKKKNAKENIKIILIEFQEKCTHLQGYRFDFKIVRPVHFCYRSTEI